MTIPLLKTAATFALLLYLHSHAGFPKNAEPLYTGAVLLNNAPVSAGQLAMMRRGSISLVRTHATSGERVKMHFFVYLKRAGKIVDANAYAHNHAMPDYELGNLLGKAQGGDQLVIEPADPSEKMFRRTITLSSVPSPIQWFPAFNKVMYPSLDKKGC